MQRLSSQPLALDRCADADGARQHRFVASACPEGTLRRRVRVVETTDFVVRPCQSIFGEDVMTSRSDGLCDLDGFRQLPVMVREKQREIRLSLREARTCEILRQLIVVI